MSDKLEREWKVIETAIIGDYDDIPEISPQHAVEPKYIPTIPVQDRVSNIIDELWWVNR